MKLPSVNLAGVSKLKKALTNFRCGPVDLIKEKHNWLSASSHKPCEGAKRCSLLTINVNFMRRGQAQQITLGHLAGPDLNDRQSIFTLLDWAGFVGFRIPR
jgi:hypothetical protein